MEKHHSGTAPYPYPQLGGSLSIPLVSADRHESFSLDIARGSIKLSKVTYQTRARVSVPLLRLDLDGPPHTNPDGVELPCPHLHVYREGYGDKWAQPVPPPHCADPSDLWTCLWDFMGLSNITVPPYIERGLFV